MEQSRQQRLATKYQISKHLQAPILLQYFPRRVGHTGLKLPYFIQSKKKVLKTMELGNNATNQLYSCSKWPFWEANMKINFILVYWDARSSLFYKLVIPFKDGVTFAVTTATQSLQRCYLENVADVTYVVVTKCDFWNIFLNF